MGPEYNPADDVQPTKEEWEQYEKENQKSVRVIKQDPSDTLLPSAGALSPFPCSEAEDLLSNVSIPAPKPLHITNEMLREDTKRQWGSWGNPSPLEVWGPLQEVKRMLDVGQENTHELQSIRATLLVNFGEQSEHNKYPFTITDVGTTHSLLVEVLTKLTRSISG